MEFTLKGRIFLVIGRTERVSLVGFEGFIGLFWIEEGVMLRLSVFNKKFLIFLVLDLNREKKFSNKIIRMVNEEDYLKL